MPRHDDQFRSPFDQPEEFNRAVSAVDTQRASALAILSVVAGVLSVPMMCLCFFSLPFSLFAIVFGHVVRGAGVPGHVSSSREIATAGMLLGYFSLIMVGGALLLGFGASKVIPPAVPTAVPQAQNDAAVASAALLTQAESQLLANSETKAIGVSTTDADADALAAHFIETLHLLDSTHFAETNEDVQAEPRAYRVFAQINDGSVALLVRVPDLERFTPSALQTLRERCWLIAQRSVDDLLEEGDRLAVALYAETGVKHIMTGVAAKSGPSEAGMQKPDATLNDLAAFFQLVQTSETNAAQSRGNANGRVDSQIDNKATPGELPAEVE